MTRRNRVREGLGIPKNTRLKHYLITTHRALTCLIVTSISIPCTLAADLDLDPPWLHSLYSFNSELPRIVWRNGDYDQPIGLLEEGLLATNIHIDIALLSLESGEEIWIWDNIRCYDGCHATLCGEGLYLALLNVNSGHGHTGLMIELDPSTGREIRSVPVDGWAIDAPAVGDDAVVIPFEDGRLLGIMGETVQWSLSVAPMIPGSATYHDGVFYFGTSAPEIQSEQFQQEIELPQMIQLPNGPGLHAIEANTGQELWFSPTSGDVLGHPIIYRGILYCAVDSSGICAFESATGRAIWRRDDCYTKEGRMAICNDLLLYTAQSGTACLDLATGELIWRNDLLRGYDGSLVVMDDMLYIPTITEALVASRLDTGQELWALKTGRYSKQISAFGSTLFLSTLGAIEAIESCESGYHH